MCSLHQNPMACLSGKLHAHQHQPSLSLLRQNSFSGESDDYQVTQWILVESKK